MPHGVCIPVLLMRQTQFCKTVLRIRLVLNPQKTNFLSEAIQIFLLGYSSMPTTKKNRKRQGNQED